VPRYLGVIITVTLTVSALMFGGSRDAAAEVMRARAVCVEQEAP